MHPWGKGRKDIRQDPRSWTAIQQRFAIPWGVMGDSLLPKPTTDTRQSICYGGRRIKGWRNPLPCPQAQPHSACLRLGLKWEKKEQPVHTHSIILNRQQEMAVSQGEDRAWEGMPPPWYRQGEIAGGWDGAQGNSSAENEEFGVSGSLKVTIATVKPNPIQFLTRLPQSLRLMASQGKKISLLRVKCCLLQCPLFLYTQCL